MRIFKSVISFILAVLFFVSCNAAAIFLLEPYGSRVHSKWIDYYQMDNVDTVLIGNSLIEVGVSPVILDQKCATHSCNLGSSQQDIEESFLGLRTVIKNRGIETAIVSVEPAYLQVASYPSPGKPFLREKNRHDLGSQLYDLFYLMRNWSLLKGSDSINWVFPYIKNHVALNVRRIADNAKMKIEKSPSVQEVAAQESMFKLWYGQGYFNTEDVFNFNEGPQETYRDSFGNTKELQPDRLKSLEDICALCENNGVDLIVIIPPLARFNVLDYGDEWFRQTDVIRSIVELHGATFYDCNLLKTEVFPFKDSYFYNNQHLNIDGAESFTAVLGDILNDRKRGNATDCYFYTPEEYTQSFQEVAFVQMEMKSAGNVSSFTARGIASPGVEVEYEFLIQKGGKKREWEVVREYASDRTFEYELPNNSDYRMRVNARVKGSKGDYDHYRIINLK